MHINRFLHSHLDSMSRTNKFEVAIHGPNGLSSRAIRCTDVTMPAIKINTKQHKALSSGPNSHYITGVEYSETVELKFMLDNTFEDRQLMERWQHMMYDEVWNLSYPEEYHGSVIITQLANDGLPNYEVELHKAFPDSIGEMAYTAGDGSIQTFTVGFKFRTWSTSYPPRDENSQTETGLLWGLFNKLSRKIQSRVTKKIEQTVFKKIRPGGLVGKILD